MWLHTLLIYSIEEIRQDYRAEPEYIIILSSSSHANQPAVRLFPHTLFSSRQDKLTCG